MFTRYNEGEDLRFTVWSEGGYKILKTAKNFSFNLVIYIRYKWGSEDDSVCMVYVCTHVCLVYNFLSLKMETEDENYRF